MTDQDKTNLQADRDHWHSEAMRYRTGLVELQASIRELRATLDASQSVIDGMDRACDWAGWRELVQEATTNAISFAQAFRKRVQ